jgi:Xaa-Pro aminopeptidase
MPSAAAPKKSAARPSNATARPESKPEKGSPKGTGKSRGGPGEAKPAEIFGNRLRRLAAAAREASLSHILISNPIDVGYLTGFLGGDSYLLLATGGGNPTIISDFRYKEELEPIAALCQVVMRQRSMGEAVAQQLADYGDDVERVGVQAEHMTVAERDALAKRVGPKKVASTVGVIARMRAVKDQHEITLIRKAIQIQEAALMAVLPTIEAGQSEMEIAARLESEMKSRGSSKPGFETIVAARANGSLPHYRPQAVKTAANQALLIDWGAVYKGYHGDMTRTFALGKWPKKIREIYEIVLEAHEKAAAALAPGKSSSDIDKIAREHIAQAGYGEYFGHGLGHGLGMNGHEDPRLTHMLAGSRLQAGNVVTIEPGIYLPGVGGVRIEDDYLITESGSENLCSLPKSLEWSTLG